LLESYFHFSGSLQITFFSQIALGGADFEIVSTNKIAQVRRIILITPKFSLLLLWQASSTGKVRSEAANPVVSRLGRLCTSQIPKALSVSSAVMPPRHHLPAWPSEIGEHQPIRY